MGWIILRIRHQMLSQWCWYCRFGSRWLWRRRWYNSVWDRFSCWKRDRYCCINKGFESWTLTLDPIFLLMIFHRSPFLALYCSQDWSFCSFWWSGHTHGNILTWKEVVHIPSFDNDGNHPMWGRWNLGYHFLDLIQRKFDHMQTLFHFSLTY